MRSESGPDADGFYWVLRTSGRWDVARWDSKYREWYVIDGVGGVTTEKSEIIGWRLIEAPGPVEAY
jgi:hypothetical protein